jgi:hypothetical protein
MMQLDEFEDLLDRHGDDLATWPAPSREAASALLKVSPDARELLDDARSMRAMFDRQATVSAPPALASRILADARAMPVAAHSFNWMRPALTLAICCVAGFGLSFVPPQDSANMVRVDLPALFSGLWQ